MAYLSLPGTGGSGAKTPNTAALRVADGSDFTIIWKGQVTGFSNAQTLIDNYGTFDADGWRVLLTGGALFYQAFNAGRTSVAVAPSTLGWVADTDIWIKLEYDSGTNQVRWYSSTTDTNDYTAVTWGAAKETDSFTHTFIAAAGADVGIGIRGPGDDQLLAGRCYRAVLLDDSSVATLDADFSDPSTWNFS